MASKDRRGRIASSIGTKDWHERLLNSRTSQHETRLTGPLRVLPATTLRLQAHGCPPRMFSPPATRHPNPTPSQQATTDLGAVLLHLEAQRRADALQREEKLRVEQRQCEEDRRTDRQAADSALRRGRHRQIHAIRPNLLCFWRRAILHGQQWASMWSAAP